MRHSALLLASTLSCISLSIALAQDTVVLDEISVTSTKTEDKVIDTLSGTSVIHKSEIQRTNPARLSDMLHFMPGIASSENHNDPGTAINIRGLQDFGRVNVLVDGARQNFQRSGHSANGMFYLNPDLIGGVDITRGPTATVQGSGAIGGVAAFRTRNINDLLSSDEKMGISQKLGWGTNGSGMTTSTSVGIRAGEKADFFGQLSYKNAHNFSDGAGNKIIDTGQSSPSGLAKMNWRPLDGHELSFSVLSQEFDFINGLGTSRDPRRKTQVQANTLTAGYTFQPENNSWIDLSLKTYYTTTDTNQLQLTPLTGLGNTRFFGIATTGFDAFNTSRIVTGPVSHKITYGGDYFFDRVQTNDPFGSSDLFTPSGNRRVIGGFIEDEIRYNNLIRFIGALRYDDYKLVGAGNEATGSRLSPKITFGVTPIQGIEVYGTYAEGYRAPAVTETLINGTHPAPAPFAFIPNVNLKPETAKTFEIGINSKFNDILRQEDSLRVKISAFQNNISDYIDAVVLPTPAPFGSYTYQNISKARIYGVEGEAAYDWGGGFSSLSLTVLDGENVNTRSELASISPTQLSQTVGLRFLDKKLTLGTRLSLAEGKTPPAGSTLLASKRYGLVDLFASYEPNEKVRADLRLNNLLDKRYVNYLNSSFTVMGALTVKFASK